MRHEPHLAETAGQLPPFITDPERARSAPASNTPRAEGIGDLEAWEVRAYANEIKEAIRAEIPLSNWEIDSGTDPDSKRPVEASWFRIRKHVFELLSLTEALDPTSELARQLRPTIRYTQKLLDTVAVSTDKTIREDIRLLRNFIANNVKAITQHHYPEYFSTRSNSPLRARRATPDKVSAKPQKIDTAPRVKHNPDTTRALELAETAEAMLDANVRLGEDNAAFYLQKNLLELHQLCLTGDVDQAELIRAFNPATHRIEGIEFLLDSIRCVLEGRPSPLVRRRAEQIRTAHAAAEKRKAQRAATPAKTKRRPHRSEAFLQTYQAATANSPLGIAKTVVEENEASLRWVSRVVKACNRGLTDAEFRAVFYQLRELSSRNNCAVSGMIALMVVRPNIEALRSIVEEHLKRLQANSRLDKNIIATAREAEKRTGRKFQFLATA
jgi:hypothetical protein